MIKSRTNRLLIRNLSLVILIFFTFNSNAQNYTLPLWDCTPPNYKDTGEKEIREFKDGIEIISNVQKPTIDVFLPSPEKATGQAVIICPGGGYWILAYDLEGTDIAKYFISKGIAAIVLKYRLPVSKSNIEPHKTPLLDAKRAMRMVRYNAEKWNINPNQIGIMGFSAGGHLASTLSTHFDPGTPQSNDSIERQSCRPDFSVLVYPVISSSRAIIRESSFYALFGNKMPSDDMIKYYSNELMVSDSTPPAILIHANDDTGVSPNNSIDYYQALHDKGITTELHIYPYGGHGFGLASDKEHLSEWPERCVNFIRFLFNTKE